MDLYNSIVSRVDERFHPRVKEILVAVDKSLSYEVITLSSPIAVRDFIRNSERDIQGFHRVDNILIVLTGDVTLIPQCNVSGELVIVLNKSILKSPHTNELVYKNVIAVYGKKESISSKIGGLIQC